MKDPMHRHIEGDLGPPFSQNYKQTIIKVAVAKQFENKLKKSDRITVVSC